jgi:hypothetical protein
MFQESVHARLSLFIVIIDKVRTSIYIKSPIYLMCKNANDYCADCDLFLFLICNQFISHDIWTFVLFTALPV